MLSSAAVVSSKRSARFKRPEVAAASAQVALILDRSNVDGVVVAILHALSEVRAEEVQRAIQRFGAPHRVVLDLLLDVVGSSSRADRKQIELACQALLESRESMEELSLAIYHIFFLTADVAFARSCYSRLYQVCPQALREGYLSFLFERGYLGEALEVLSAPTPDSGDRGVHRMMQDAIKSELAVLQTRKWPEIKQRSGYVPVPKRVLHLVSNAMPEIQSGYTLRTQAILVEQLKLGMEVAIVIAPGDGKPHDCSYQFCGVMHYCSPPASQRKVGLEGVLRSYLREVERAIEEFKPEIIHAHSYFINAICGSIAAKSFGIPLVYELRGLWEDTQVAEGMLGEDSDRYNLSRQAETDCLELANSVVTLSECQKRELIDRGLNQGKIFVVPNGVSAAQFENPSPTEVDRLRGTLKIGQKFVFGYLGSMASYEGLELLLKAFSELPRGVAHLVLLGGGETFARLKLLIRQLAVDGDVSLLSRVPQEQIINYMALIDAFVLARLPVRVCQLVSPIKPFEAMAAGKLVLAPDLPIFREILNSGERGVLYKAGDCSALSNQLAKVCSEGSLWEGRAVTASHWVRGERSWGKVVAQYGAPYQFALRSRSV